LTGRTCGRRYRVQLRLAEGPWLGSALAGSGLIAPAAHLRQLERSWTPIEITGEPLGYLAGKEQQIEKQVVES
jgi:hypothetical protein